ncbi:MAG: enoyl-CoA hydratase [Candidatus Hydrogenedentes bacterium]|nr:enoyl-CoA hydratase [Candidatus Hydrogenedentota bacterium]
MDTVPQNNGVLVEITDGVMALRLNRPEKKNALNAAMYTALVEAMEAGHADPSVRVLLFLGGDACFSSGNDIKDFLFNPPQDETHPVMRFLAALVNAEKPLVAAVNGPAVGIGTTMLLHCDLVYAAENARFHLPFVSLGLCPEAGSSLLLPALAGPARAAEAILLGKPFDAPTALSWGIINDVCLAGAADAAAWEAAKALAKLPPAAVRASRRLLRGGMRAAVENAIRAEAGEFVERLKSPEAAEAFQAFLERRPPDFSQFS